MRTTMESEDAFGGSETSLRAKGWTRKRIRALEARFETLSYDQIGVLLDVFGIAFGVPIEQIRKDEIAWTIADDKTFEQINEAIDKLL
jgi:hypothetical protein